MKLHYIAEWIEHCGVTKKFVAAHVGVVKSNITRWCSGEGLELINLHKVAAALGVPVWALLLPPLDGEVLMHLDCAIQAAAKLRRAA